MEHKPNPWNSEKSRISGFVGAAISGCGRRHLGFVAAAITSCEGHHCRYVVNRFCGHHSNVAENWKTQRRPLSTIRTSFKCTWEWNTTPVENKISTHARNHCNAPHRVPRSVCSV